MSHNLKLKLNNWRVCKRFNGSDHNTIMYNLETDLIKIPSHRPYKKAEWGEFTEKLNTMDIYIPNEFSQQ